MLVHVSRLGLVCLVALAAFPTVADEPIQPEQPRFERGTVYRFDPITEVFSPIDRASLKPLHIYYRFSPILDRWVWSKTTPDGRLEFAMGPGSVQQAFLFDLTATMEERMRVLRERAPDLARQYGIQGARASMILGTDGTWALHGVQSLGHVYDLETGRRWEWHGDHRAEVVHCGGNLWQHQAGLFTPAWFTVGCRAGCE